MYIVEVVPLTNIPIQSPQALSYFCKENLKPSSLVTIPLSGRELNAIVKETFDAKDKKLELKRKSFELKKIIKVISSEPILTDSQIEIGSYLHNYYLSSLGAILKLFLPKALINRKTAVEISPVSSASEIKKERSQPLLLWRRNRNEFYLGEIERTAKEGGQILLLEPEISKVKKSADKIVEEGCVNKSEISVLHGGLNTSREFKEWKNIRQNDSKVIIGTRSSVFFPYGNLATIIVDEEESSNYKSWHQYPRYNAKRVAKKLAETKNAELILGTDLPSIEIYHEVKEGRCKSKKQIEFPDTEIKMIDMKKEEKDNKDNFIFSSFLEQELKRNLDANKQSIVFINRRGTSTSIICRDCGQTVECKKCEAPMVYHKNKKGEEYLMCHHCGAKENTPNVCPNCGGHRIKYFGTGTQKVKRELQDLFKKAEILRLDSDTASDFKKQKQILDKFKSQSDILVGTRLLLKFKEIYATKVDLAAVVLTDPLLNFPDFRAQERAFNILMNLKVISKKLVIQTYNPSLSIFDYLKNNEVEEFFKAELEDRRQLSYPPFSNIIKISFLNKNSKRAEREAEKFKINVTNNISKKVNAYTEILGPTPAFIPKVKDKYIWNLVFKSRSHGKKLKDVLQNLMPNRAKVDVDPTQLL